jgi:hypothetical protein
MPQDPATQLDLFRQACAALGGQSAAARYLKVTDRQIRFLLAGDREIHDGFLRDIAAALLEHAALCKQLEHRLTPAFAANLTPHQLARQGKPDGRRFDARENANG